MVPLVRVHCTEHVDQGIGIEVYNIEFFNLCLFVQVQSF